MKKKITQPIPDMSWINDVKYLCLKYVGSFADGYVTVLVLNLSVQGLMALFYIWNWLFTKQA